MSTGAELTELIGKGASPRWQGFAYGNEGMLFVTSENVRDGYLDVSVPKFLPLAFHEKLSRTKLRRDDILVNLVGASIGRTCRVKNDLGPANVNQAVAVFRLIDLRNAPYVEFFFQLPATIKRILEMQADAARPNISLGNLRSFPIVLPPLEEQRSIVAILSDVEALLGALEQAIAKKRDIKQAAMQQLLTGQTRLPGFSGCWDKRRLGDVVSIYNGGTPRTGEPSFWDGNIAWCTPTDITKTSGKYLAFTERTISKAGLEGCSAQLLPTGAILLCTRATIGELKIAAREVCTNQGFKSLVANKGVNNEFLYYTLLMMKAAMIERATGSTFLELSKRDTASLSLAMPAYAEQSAIAIILSDMDAELSALEQRRDKTRLLKQGMMQELLTGRTRLV